MLPFVFEPGFGFERYVDYAARRADVFRLPQTASISTSRASPSATSWTAGCRRLPGEVPTISDWADHLTTAFPEVRLKRYLEMRGADTGPWQPICALPALWTGLLYDQVSLDAAADLVADWTDAEREHLRSDVPRLGLHTAFRGGTIQGIAQEMVALAKAGLARRARMNWDAQDETRYLKPLEQIALTGVTPAEDELRRYQESWGHSVDPAFTELAF